MLGVSNPSCRLRGINGRQLARLSTVFLAFPEEDEQSVCAGRGASAAQRERPGSRLPGLRPAPERETRPGRGRPSSRTAASRLGGGLARADLPGSPRQGGGLWVGSGSPRRLARAEAPWLRPRVLPAPKVNLLLLFCSSPDTGRISTAARSQPLRIARKGRKICGIN